MRRLLIALCLCLLVAAIADGQPAPIPVIHPSGSSIARSLQFGASRIDMTRVPPIPGQCLEFNGTGITGAACSSAGGFPTGNTPQLAGFSGVNASEAETLGGDCTLSRGGANSYTIACTSSGGNPFTGATFGASLNLSTLFSQDCTISAGGVVTCLRTNNVPFVASATTNTTNAANISSGLLPLARIPASNGSCVNQTVLGLAAGLVPTCATITSSYVNNTIALTGTDINTSNQVTVTHLAAALPPAQGGTGSTTAPGSGQLAIGNGTVYIPKTASGSCTVDLNGVFTCSASGTYPSGNSPQIGGFSALNTSEAETVSGDFAFTRAGANSYTANVSSLLGGLMTFSGPATTLKTYTLPNASTTILTANAAVTAGQGGTGSASVPTSGQVPVGNAGGTAYAPQSLSQDCTMTSGGVVTCTKTNNVAFATSATTDTTNATNISSGTLAVARGGTGIGTLPSSGQLLVGNAGGTAYAPKTASGSCTVDNNGVFTCGGTGTVASGTIGHDAYYAATGNTVSSKAGIISPCAFPGATADVQINAAQAALSAGGIIDARCYGGTTQTIAAPVTISPGTSGTAPTEFMFDTATTFNCTITGGTTSCWNVGSSGSMIGNPGGVNGVSPNAGFALAASGNVKAVITNVPASTTFLLEGAFVTGSSGTIGKGAIWLNAPLQPVVLKAVSVGGTANAVLLFISNDGGSAIGPVEVYDPNIDCNNAVGCTPMKMGPPTTSNVFSGITFIGGLFNHPGATLPAIDIEASGTFGNPTSITFVNTLIEGNSIATTPTGFLMNGGNGITIIDPQSSVGGTDFIKIQNVGAAAPANITVTTSSNPGGWTNNLHNVITGYIDTSFNVPYYSYNGSVENHIVLEDSSSKKTTLAANALTLGGSFQFGVAVATPGASPTAIIGKTGGGPATAAQNSWQSVKLSDGTTGYIPIWK